MKTTKQPHRRAVIGIDLGDKQHAICVLDKDGNALRWRVPRVARKPADYENQAALSKKAVRLNADQNRRAIEKFFERVRANWARSEKEFRDHMASRGSQDYPRSDILGAIAVSASLMGQDYPDYIVLNSDLDHRPTRTDTPPQTLKIHPETVVIPVNQSLLPERSPLIAGIPNEVLRASSLAEAFAAIAERESPSQPAK